MREELINIVARGGTIDELHKRTLGFDHHLAQFTCRLIHIEQVRQWSIQAHAERLISQMVHLEPMRPLT